MPVKIAVGDKVRFSTRFIKSIQGHEIAHHRGIVKEIIVGKGGSPDRAVIDWGEDEGQSRALTSNLTKA
jgi:hypothetical protein